MFDTESYKKLRNYNRKMKEEQEKITIWKSLPAKERNRILQQKKEREAFAIVNYNHKKRIFVKEHHSNVTLQDWKNILNKQNNICLSCNQLFSDKNKPTQDHIIPLSRGGWHNKENIQALCLKCNSKKGAK